MVDERIDSSNDIEVLGSFSSGYLGFATLSLARSRRISPSSSSPHYMIVKHFSLDSFESRGSRWGVSYGALEMAHREASLLKSLQHERVVRLLASFETRSELWLVLRYHDLGSASDLLRRAFANGMPESLVAHVLRAVLQALQYLHAQHLVHRAVRAAHVLLASDGRVALSGFHACVSMVEEGSLSERLFDYPHEYAPEYLPWLAPEVLEQNQLGYDTKSDLYSLGVTACELSTAQVPFAAPPTRLMLEKVNGVKPALFRLAAPADGDKVCLLLSQFLYSHSNSPLAPSFINYQSSLMSKSEWSISTV